MRPNPVSVRDSATLPEVMDLFIEKGLGATPVINEAGSPVGVVSHSDLLIHHRQAARRPGSAELGLTSDPTTVRDVMTPAVFSVTPDTPMAKVVEQMLALKVHHLF